MNELITIENCVAILNPETTAMIVEFERKAKEIEEKQKELRSATLAEMQEKKVRSLKTEEISITLKDAYEREDFQKKEFKADHPDLYDSYIKMTPVKASVVIKLNEEK